MDNIHSASAKLHGFVKELNKTDVSGQEVLVDGLLSVLDSIPPLDVSQAEHRAVHAQIEQNAVSLWNCAVAKKTGGTLSEKLNARVRHVATNLVFLCNNNTREELTLKKQTVMALKTARAWIDAKEPIMAENHLSMASECVEKLRQLLSKDNLVIGDSPSEESARKKNELEKDCFKILCYKAEVAVCGGENDSALSLAARAKEMLAAHPQEGCYLSMLCYNFGVECYQKKNYEAGASWLRESFDIGKSGKVVGSKNQARTLRLLANTYLEWDGILHCQKALNAVSLANTEHSHPAGLFLKMKILLQGNSDDEKLRNGLSDILRHPDLSCDLGLSTVNLAFQHDKSSLGYEGLEQLSARFRDTPDKNKVNVSRLELLLRGEQMRPAKDLMEGIITDHNTGSPLDLHMIKQLHILAWDRAAQEIEKGSHSEALDWYNFSLSVFLTSAEQSEDLAKLHRNRASCLIEMSNYVKAEEVLREAERSDSASPHTQYLQFKTYLLTDQEQKAIDALKRMSDICRRHGEYTNDAQSLICLAAQLAFEKNNSNVSVKALESLVDFSPDPHQVLTALRCLCRLRITSQTRDKQQQQSHSSERPSLISYLNTAHEKLLDLCVNGTLLDSNARNEASWFMKIAWNIALQCSDATEDMHTLFMLCSKITELCPQDVSCLVRQKTCLLMSAAASLQTARQTDTEDQKTAAFITALEHTEACKKIYHKLEEMKLSSSDANAGRGKDTTSPLLLVLLEFEARVKLGDQGAELVLEQALAIPQCDHKVFETISALAMDPPMRNRSLSIRALKVAIRKHLQMDNIDYNRCSKTFHSLIELSLQTSTVSELATSNEAWTYFTDVTEIIETRAPEGSYPEMEILWIMTKAWNCGIHLYSTSHLADAVRWCELAMKLLKHLNSMKGNYQTQMTTVYGEILEKMGADKMQTDDVPAS